MSAASQPPGKDPAPRRDRRLRGFEPAAGLLRDPIRKAGETRGFALSRLLTQWAEIVGEEIAAIAQPARIGYGREGMGGTLTLLVSGAAAPVVQMQLPRIQERVNGCYGYNAIARISLTQTAATGFAEGQTPFRPKPADAAPDPAIHATAEALSRDVGDETLRAALEALGEKVLSRPRSRKG
ncbi:DUF721 domain-containing protein [Frigidibacter sp. SD6-1]|uniref:DUF721 domain-containing protein n=1 Tax=Frigidibacter sp. SD6-1 TaxID=3032581 RepID=UPI0024DF587E|nr:DUF721 domain-containing protein [Frigidibacter sp. SD6-1]